MSQSWKDNRLIIPDDIVFNVNTSNDPRGPYRLLPLTFIDKIWRPDSFFKVNFFIINNKCLSKFFRQFLPIYVECKRSDLSRNDHS